MLQYLIMMDAIIDIMVSMAKRQQFLIKLGFNFFHPCIIQLIKPLKYKYAHNEQDNRRNRHPHTKSIKCVLCLYRSRGIQSTTSPARNTATPDASFTVNVCIEKMTDSSLVPFITSP